jgi:hypothetical protein
MELWSKEKTIKYLLNYHYIHNGSTPSIEDVFNRVHSIQYDPLYVVGFQHDLMLQSRVKNYKAGDLYKLMYDDKLYIDHWDRIAAIIDVKDYPYLLPIREKRAESIKRDVLKYMAYDVSEHEKEILEILESGVTSTKDMKLGERIDSRWWNSRQSGFTIDYLLQKGDIAIDHRIHSNRQIGLFNQIYQDMPENKVYKDSDEFLLYYLKRRIETVGITWNKSHNILTNPFLSSMKARQVYFDQLVEKKDIIPFKIEGIDEVFYRSNRRIEINDIQDKISFISPLDNLIWDRPLIKLLFDFDYKWEVYVPKAKRQYGFYVLPILYKNKFIGRIEFQKLKNHESLHILSLYYEDNIKHTKKLDIKLKQALKRFQKYLDAESIIY